LLLAAETVALLVMQPAKLLKDLCMLRVSVKHTSISRLGIVVIFLLLMDMSNLEPNVLFSQRGRWHGNNVSETLKTLLILLLLFVDYTEPKVDFVGLFEIGLHAHDLRKSFLGMLKRPISIIQDANAIPKFWFLRVSQVIQGLLVRRVSLLQVVHHQVTVAQTAPNISIISIKLEDVLKILDSLVELLLCPQDAADGIHGRNRSWIGTQCAFVRRHSFFQIAQKLCKTPYLQPHRFVHRDHLLLHSRPLLLLRSHAWRRRTIRRPMVQIHARRRGRVVRRHGSIRDVVVTFASDCGFAPQIYRQENTITPNCRLWCFKICWKDSIDYQHATTI
jgi:hypothetical protein